MVDAHDFAGALHLGAEVRIDADELAHGEDRCLDGDEFLPGPETTGVPHFAQCLAELDVGGEADHWHAGDL